MKNLRKWVVLAMALVSLSISVGCSGGSDSTGPDPVEPVKEARWKVRFNDDSSMTIAPVIVDAKMPFLYHGSRVEINLKGITGCGLGDLTENGQNTWETGYFKEEMILPSLIPSSAENAFFFCSFYTEYFPEGVLYISKEDVEITGKEYEWRKNNRSPSDEKYLLSYR